MERYPTLVHDFVWRNSMVFPSIKDDLVSSLYLHLAQKQTIEKYDPALRNFDTTEDGKERLYLHYVYTCLRRAQQTIMTKWKRDAMYHASEPQKRDLGPNRVSHSHKNFGEDWTDDYAVYSADLHQRSPEPNMNTIIALDRLQELIDAKYPGYSRLLRLLRMGYTMGEIQKATGIDYTSLKFIVDQIFPSILKGAKLKTKGRAAYITLQALGEFTPIAKMIKGHRTLKSHAYSPKLTVQNFCAHCGGEFWLSTSGYRFRKKGSKTGELCCSTACANKRKEYRKRMERERIKY